MPFFLVVMPMVLGLNWLRNCGCGSARSHDCQLVYCLVTTRAAYITIGYRLQPALAATAATLKRTGPGNESLTPCQVNTTRVPGRRIMRRKTDGPGNESLTACQVNTTSVPGKRIMRRKRTGPGNESLTPCQVNTTRVPGRRIDRKSTRLNSSHVVTSRMPSSA